MRSPPLILARPGAPRAGSAIGVAGLALGLLMSVSVLLLARAWAPEPESDLAPALIAAHRALVEVADAVRAARAGGMPPWPQSVWAQLDPCLAWGAADPAPRGVWVLSGESTKSAPCLPDQVPGTDALWLRGLAATFMDPGQRQSGAAYVQLSACTQDAQPWQVGGREAAMVLRGPDCRALAPVRQLVVHSYYLRTCRECGGGAAPQWVRRSWQGAGWSSVVVVPRAEDVRWDLGFDLDADGTPERWARTPSSRLAAGASWAHLAALRVTLRVRGPQPRLAGRDPARYPMGLVGDAGPFNDAWPRGLVSRRIDGLAHTPGSARLTHLIE